MSHQDAVQLSSTALFLEPATGLLAEQSPPVAVHHPMPEPADHMCTCGKVREACVHDEIRALWGAVGGASGAATKDLGA